MTRPADPATLPQAEEALPWGVLRTSADLQRATRLAQDFPGITGVRSQVNVQSEWLKR